MLVGSIAEAAFVDQKELRLGHLWQFGLVGFAANNDQRNRAATLRVDFSLARIRRTGARNCYAADRRLA